MAMSMIEKIRATFKVIAGIKKIKGAYMSTSKPGISSSEFWLTLLTVGTTLSETFKGNIDPKWGAIISASLTLGYAIVRGVTKASSSIGGTNGKEA